MAHVYVAAPWTCKAEARKFALKLEDHGHDITERWWQHREVDSYPSLVLTDVAELREQADRDLAGIDDADAVVVLQLAKSEGKAFETGYAYNAEKPICVVIGREYGNLFQVMPKITLVSTFDEVLRWLSTL